MARKPVILDSSNSERIRLVGFCEQDNEHTSSYLLLVLLVSCLVFSSTLMIKVAYSVETLSKRQSISTGLHRITSQKIITLEAEETTVSINGGNSHYYQRTLQRTVIILWTFRL